MTEIETFKNILKENALSDLTELEKDVVKDMVKADFECGMPQNDYTAIKELMDEDDCIENADAAAQYYLECVEMGPAGFYEENPEMDWSDDFVAEYREKEAPVTNSSEKNINDCADWYKTSQIESLMYMNKGMTPSEAKEELGIDPSFEYVPTGHLDESTLREAFREEFFDCVNSPMSINSVADFIENCEHNGHVAILTVNTSDGRAYHTQFSSKTWKEFKDSVNGVDDFSRNSNLKGAAITKVWAKECDPKNTLGESIIFDRILKGDN